MKFRSGECDKVLYRQAVDGMMRMTKEQMNKRKLYSQDDRL